jgi:hypothetical protein
MLPFSRRSRPEDQQTHHLFHYTDYPKIAKLLLLVLVVSAIGAFCYPYLNLLFYPYVISATIPTPEHASQVVSNSSLSTSCHTSSILHIYRTDRPFEEIRNFYTNYIQENTVWALVDEGVPSASSPRGYWISSRYLIGENASNQHLTLSLRRFEIGMFDGYIAEEAQRALRDGKTVYFLVVAYTDDFKQNRAAVADPTSECFID